MANLTFLEALNKSLGVTKKYVDNSVAGIVDSAPETLNTLKELSTALGDDPNFATTVATNIGKKVDKIEGKTLTANDLTNELKANYDTAYTHSQVAHAPADAQKNSDITKDEIEAKLIGDVSSHTHSQYLTEHQNLDEYASKKYVDDKMANLSIVKISKADFEALTTKDANTLYLVLEDS